MLRLTIVDEARRENAKDWARPFTARLLEPGLVSYVDRGCGISLLRKPALDACAKSFIGRPIVVRQTAKIKPQYGRGEYVHEETSPENMKEIGHGYVTDVFYNDSDGWWYAKGLVDTDEAVEAINGVGKCSCGYKVLKAGPGGKHHDIGYNDEILEFDGEHLAVVDRPRYEDATIRLNSKATQTETTMKFAFWKKTPSVSGAAKPAADATPAPAAAPQTVENGVSEITGESEIEFTGADGKPAKATIAQLVEARNSAGEMDGDDEVNVNGKKVKLNALIEAFDKWTKHNAAEEEKKEKGDDKKENALAAAPVAVAAAPAVVENAKTGPDFFRLVDNAAATHQAPAVKHVYNSRAECLARGAELYGSPKKTSA